MCGSGKDEVLNRHENQDGSEGRRGGPLWFAALLMVLIMCGGGKDDGPTEAEARQVIDRQRKSLRLYIDSERRRNGGEQRFAVLGPLRSLARVGSVS